MLKHYVMLDVSIFNSCFNLRNETFTVAHFYIVIQMRKDFVHDEKTLSHEAVVH